MSLPHELSPYLIKIKNQPFAGGRMSDIYRCWYQDKSTRIEVAVKALRFKFTMDGSDKESKGAKMFRQELAMWKRLDHVNIVPFLGIAYGLGLSGSMSLVSLWMPNGSFHNFLATHDSILQVAHRLQLLLDIAKGLHYLHSFSIVHGDLNCNNVLIDATYNARLVDFGYNTLVRSIPEAVSYLQTVTLPGALRWSVPEQFDDLEIEFVPTTQSDVYSFGCVALQVLSGKPPWSEFPQNMDMAVVLHMVKGHKPGRPMSRSIDDPHWDLIQDCWSPVEKRPTIEMIIHVVQWFRNRCPESQALCDLLISTSSCIEVGTTMCKSSTSLSQSETRTDC